MVYNAGPIPKLSAWEIAEIRHRASSIMAEYPRGRCIRRLNGTGRYSRLCYLADEYGINIRTLYRYIGKAAA